MTSITQESNWTAVYNIKNIQNAIRSDYKNNPNIATIFEK